MMTFIVRTFNEEWTIGCSNLNVAVSKVLDSYSNPETATVDVFDDDCAYIYFDGHLEATIDRING